MNKKKGPRKRKHKKEKKRVNNIDEEDEFLTNPVKVSSSTIYENSDQDNTGDYKDPNYIYGTGKPVYWKREFLGIAPDDENEIQQTNNPDKSIDYKVNDADRPATANPAYDTIEVKPVEIPLEDSDIEIELQDRSEGIEAEVGYRSEVRKTKKKKARDSGSVEGEFSYFWRLNSDKYWEPKPITYIVFAAFIAALSLGFYYQSRQTSSLIENSRKSYNIEEIK